LERIAGFYWFLIGVNLVFGRIDNNFPFGIFLMHFRQREVNITPVRVQNPDQLLIANIVTIFGLLIDLFAVNEQRQAVGVAIIQIAIRHVVTIGTKKGNLIGREEFATAENG
jgi:hypothetical protein